MLPDKEFFQRYLREKNVPWQARNVLTEYVQTRILKALSLSDFAEHLSFLGGTCLRFAHHIDRFSEDLDFDLVKKRGFSLSALAGDLEKRLRLEGLAVETRCKTTDNIHIVFFRFSDVLREFGIDAQKDQKALVKFEIDFHPYKHIRTEIKFSDSFYERFPMRVNTLDTLFAQKVLALAFRPYQKGRDFYDLVWFLSQRDLEPNYAIFKEKKLPVTDRATLVSFLKTQAQKSDLKQAVRDVEKFLFFPEHAQWILRLPEYLEAF